MQSVLITCQSSKFDRQLAKIFRREGFEVFIAGKDEPDGKLDFYIDTSDRRSNDDTFSIRDGLDEKIIRQVYRANVLIPMKLLEKYLPLLDAGGAKRICFISSAAAGINGTNEIDGYAYKLSKAAMHNLYMITCNTLTADGYTFRVFDPMHGNIDPKEAAEAAFVYFTRRRGTENDDPMRDDENRLVMRDALGREHPW